MDETTRDEVARWRSGDARGSVGALAAGWSNTGGGEAVDLRRYAPTVAVPYPVCARAGLNLT